MARRALNETERTDWARFTQGITLLPGRTRLDPPPEGAPPPPPRETAPASALPRTPARPAAPLSVGVAPGGLDSGSWTRLRSGRMPPARTLDLHGRTADRAFRALHAFLVAAHNDRLRCVEVITGRGSGEAGGVIRRELPIWLNLPELRPLVLAATHPHPANPGAVRLLLRRPR